MDTEWENLRAKGFFDLNKLFNPKFLKALEENFEENRIDLIKVGILLTDKPTPENKDNVPKGEFIEINNNSFEDTLLDKITLTATDSECFEKVKKIIIDELNCAPEKVTMEAKLKDDLGADSIDAVQIIMDLEDTFGVTIEEDNAEAIQTVGNLVEYVQTLIK